MKIMGLMWIALTGVLIAPTAGFANFVPHLRQRFRRGG
jgi:hypothetical protein